jgi:hypothetical protein
MGVPEADAIFMAVGLELLDTEFAHKVPPG